MGILFTRRTSLVLLVGALLAPTSWARTRDSSVQVVGPTVIAFFVPEKGNSEPGSHEAFDDFELYAKQVRPRMNAAGITFTTVYSASLQVVIGRTSTAFHAGKRRVVAPHRKPHVEYGVITDDDLMQVARHYFGTALR